VAGEWQTTSATGPLALCICNNEGAAEVCTLPAGPLIKMMVANKGSRPRRTPALLYSTTSRATSCTFHCRSADFCDNNCTHLYRSTPSCCGVARHHLCPCRNTAYTRCVSRSHRLSPCSDAWRFGSLYLQHPLRRRLPSPRRSQARRPQGRRRPALSLYPARWRRYPDPTLDRRRCDRPLLLSSSTTQFLLFRSCFLTGLLEPQNPIHREPY